MGTDEKGVRFNLTVLLDEPDPFSVPQDHGVGDYLGRVSFCVGKGAAGSGPILSAKKGSGSFFPNALSGARHRPLRLQRRPRQPAPPFRGRPLPHRMPDAVLAAEGRIERVRLSCQLAAVA